MKKKTTRTRAGELTTIQIAQTQTPKVDAIADRMGVRRAQVVRWAIDYFDIEDFVATHLTEAAKAEQTAA